MSDNKTPHVINEEEYEIIRAKFDNTVGTILDLIYHGIGSKKNASILSNTELKTKLISFIEKVLEVPSNGDAMIDATLSIKIPHNIMALYNREMKVSIFDMIMRQVLAGLRHDWSNSIDQNEQTKIKNNAINTRK